MNEPREEAGREGAGPRAPPPAPRRSGSGGGRARTQGPRAVGLRPSAAASRSPRRAARFRFPVPDGRGARAGAQVRAEVAAGARRPGRDAAGGVCRGGESTSGSPPGPGSRRVFLPAAEGRLRGAARRPGACGGAACASRRVGTPPRSSRRRHLLAAPLGPGSHLSAASTRSCFAQNKLALPTWFTPNGD